MRRMLLTLVLACGFGLPLALVTSGGTLAQTTGPVAFTVHAASCPLEDVYNPDIGLYDACHANALEGVTFTFSSLEAEPISFATDAAGIGAADILDGATEATEVTLSVDPAALAGVGGYVYCADQISGSVLYDGVMINDGVIPLFTIDSSQTVICDWFIYTDGGGVVEAASEGGGEVVANG